MQKIYNRTYWENYPSEKTAITAMRLNNAESGIDKLDDLLIAMDAAKVDLVKANELVQEILWDESQGTLTVVKMNGSRAVIDTKLEKLAVNFDYDPQKQQLIITLDDGTTQNVDLSALITEYEFTDSDTVAFEIGSDGKVSAIVKEGSIEERHLRPDYLADIKVEAAKAVASAAGAAASEINAAASEAAADKSAVSASASAAAAAKSASEAAASEKNAKESETNAATSKTATDEAKNMAVSASAEAKDLVTDVEQKIKDGAFAGPPGIQGPKGDKGDKGNKGDKGDKGDKGETGATGASGIIVPVSGMFALAGDDAGNLWAYYNDADAAPQFETDSDGNIYYIAG